MAKDYQESYGQLKETLKTRALNNLEKQKLIRQHKTQATAQFVADKMDAAGQNIVGKEYTIQDAFSRGYKSENVKFRAEEELNIKTNNDGALDIRFKRGKNQKDIFVNWRPYHIEEVYTEELAKELKKGPKEGFILLKPENPRAVGSAKGLGDWYDPVLQKPYSEVDWVANADSFIPELKTTVEVKTRSVGSSKDKPRHQARYSHQNKGLNKENFSVYDGVVGYAIVDVQDHKYFTDAGLEEQQRNEIAEALGIGLSFGGKEVGKNTALWKHFIKNIKFNYSTQVVGYYTTMYSIEKAARYVRGILQKLGFESGKPLPEKYMETFDNASVSTKTLENLVVSYLYSVVDLQEFDGINYVEVSLRKNKSNFRADTKKVISEGDFNSPQDIINKVLLKYLKEPEFVEMFNEVAQNTGHAFASPDITMGANYESTQQISKDYLLGSATRLT